MTTLTSGCPSVFEAGLPVIAYDHLTDPDEAHRILAEARGQAPIAVGPHGPEALSYELVRTVLGDSRFVTARGLGLDLQGFTSGPLWDRAISNILGLDGAVHHRLRRLVSKAFAPRGAERLRLLVVDIITGLVDPLTAVGTATSSPTSPAAIRRRSSARYWAHHRRIGTCSATGPTTSRRSSIGTSPKTARRSWPRGINSTPTSRS